MFKRTISPVLAAVILVGSWIMSATPAEAVGCNTGGCWSGLVKLIRIAPDGKIWFVVEGSAALNNLVPQDGCVLKSVWTGQAEPALYIRSDDARAFELYTLLLTAFTTRTAVGFGPIKDAATGWCSVNSLDMS